MAAENVARCNIAVLVNYLNCRIFTPIGFSVAVKIAITTTKRLLGLYATESYQPITKSTFPHKITK